MDTLLDAGLGNAFLAAVLALPVACAARLLRRPALAHVLWLLVLLKLLTPPLVELPVPWPGEAPPEVVPAAAPPTDPEEPATFDPAEPEEESAAPPRIAPTPPALAPVAWFNGWTWRQAAAAVWLTGTLMWLATVALRVRRFRRLLRHARPAPAAVHEQARRLAERLGLARCPDVLLIDAPLSPLLWAFAGPPRLLLPAALWDRLAEEQRDTLLAHELAHLRRGDHRVRWLELAVVGLYWWHPVVWWALRELREAEEQCCDAWVVWALPGSGPVYAQALVETVAFLSQPRPPLPLGASGVGRVRLLKRRLAMIVRGNTPRTLSWVACVVVLGPGLLLLPLVPTWARLGGEEPKDRPAVSAAPDNPKENAQAAALLAKFEVLFKEGKYTEAARCARLAHELDPANPSAVAAIKLAQAQGEQAQKPAGDAPVRPGDSRAKPTAADRSEDLQKARDEVELLEVQLEVKKAQLDAAKASLPRAREREQQLRKMSAAGTGQQSAWVQAMHEVAELEGQLLVKEAELKEPEVRLKQAQRRLTNLQRLQEPQRIDPPAKKQADDPKADDDRLRLKELEKKIDTLLKELEALRRSKQQSWFKVPPDKAGDVIVINQRSMKIPFQVDPAQRGRVTQLALMVSRDEGKTWEKAAVVGPDAKEFDFRAPGDGLYWLRIAAVGADTEYGVDYLVPPPGLKVLVQAEK